ncbi:hypothetical protein R5W23_003586 [Gemmata sp. JC673]|uniref:SMI1/KNR4 family protein n=1 Tax=Gemmata algarum TaxID=2975278 RepID=A0ABU5F5Y0_9BACT|nr:hypothetical protein [Gemmata algarum]MDY3562140.1 hypothetical protein [Gemmata algarum]
MTEAEWLARVDAQRMLELLTCELRYATRRVPAFVAAFAESERVRALLTPELHEPLDDYARWVQGDGPHPAELHPGLNVYTRYRNLDEVVLLLVTVGAVTWLDACELVRADLSQRVRFRFSEFLQPVPDAAERERHHAIRLHDIVGPLPFRPVNFCPSWRTSTAVAIARQMYKAHDFSAMPILADALQDAGCDDADVLDHCRDPNGTHARGCWVVDSVLGKE